MIPVDNPSNSAASSIVAIGVLLVVYPMTPDFILFPVESAVPAAAESVIGPLAHPVLTKTSSNTIHC